MEPQLSIAFVWLGLLLVAVIGYFVWLIRCSDYGLWESCLYLPTYLMGRLVWRVHFTNSPPKEIQGGAILVSNHRSSVDPFFVQLAARRRVHWMVAKEYCDHFVFGPILKAVQAIPTNRSGMDTASTKQAMQITRQGRLVGMFPEGRLNHTSDPLVPIRSGAALVAAKSQVPILPLFIEGSPYRRTVWSPLFIPGHVAITFGQPIYPPAQDAEPSVEREGEERFSDSDAMILEWGKQVVAMAGHPEFPVQLAAKRRRRN
ncbi:MAG: lysophospholipid acyltransferase family protein [Pirellulaceae bacterium]